MSSLPSVIDALSDKVESLQDATVTLSEAGKKVSRDLPSDVWQIIADNLQYPGQHIALSQTCTSARLIYSDDRTWQKLCHHLGIGRPTVGSMGHKKLPGWREVFVRVVAHQGKCRVGYCYHAGVYARNSIGDLLDTPERIKQHYITFNQMQHDEQARRNKERQEKIVASMREQAVAQGQGQFQTQLQDQAQPTDPNTGIPLPVIATAGAGVGYAGGLFGMLHGTVNVPGQGLPAAAHTVGTTAAPTPAPAPAAGTANAPTAPAAPTDTGGADSVPGLAAATGSGTSTGTDGEDDDGDWTDDDDTGDTEATEATGATGATGDAGVTAGFGDDLMDAIFDMALSEDNVNGFTMDTNGNMTMNGPAGAGSQGAGTGAAGQPAPAQANAAASAPADEAGPAVDHSQQHTGDATAVAAASAGINPPAADSATAPSTTSLPTATASASSDASANGGTPAVVNNADATAGAGTQTGNANPHTTVQGPAAPPTVPGVNPAAAGPGTAQPNTTIPGANMHNPIAQMANLMASLFGPIPVGPPGNPDNNLDGAENDEDDGQAGAAIPPAFGPLFGLPPWAVPPSGLPAGHPQLKRSDKPKPTMHPDLFPLSKSHWRNVFPAPIESHYMCTGGNVLFYRFLAGKAMDDGAAIGLAHDRTGGHVDDWAGWSEGHERDRMEGFEVDEHAILKFAFATNPPVTEITATVGGFIIKIYNPTGITNLDVVKQISSYLAKTMGSKERQKRLENDHARHTLASRKVQAGKVKTRLDLIKVGDGSFGCVCQNHGYLARGQTALNASKGKVSLHFDLN